MDEGKFKNVLRNVAKSYAESVCPTALTNYMAPAFRDGARWAFGFIESQSGGTAPHDKDNPPSELTNQREMEIKEAKSILPVVVYTSDEDKRDDRPTYLGQIIHIMSYGGGKVIAVVRIVKVYKHMPDTPEHWHRPDSLQTFFVTSICAIREGTRYAEDYDEAMKIKDYNDPRIYPTDGNGKKRRP